VIQITYPSGRIVTYVRDAQGRVTSVTTKQNATAAVVTLASGITWQPFSGLVSGMTYGNGLTEADSYSLDYEVNRLLLQNGPTSLIDRTHSHTDLLNLTGITDAVTPANTQSFSYAATNRLATASGVYGAYSWSYDGVGNRTQEVLGSATNVYSLPVGSNRLTTVTQGATTLRSFLYDANGNILNDIRSGTLYAYTYNQNNRLKTVTVTGNLKATYTYNAQEQLAVRVPGKDTEAGQVGHRSGVGRLVVLRLATFARLAIEQQVLNLLRIFLKGCGEVEAVGRRRDMQHVLQVLRTGAGSQTAIEQWL